MDRKKLYRQLIDNNPLRAAELTEYKNNVARLTRAKKEALKKAEAAKREALEAKATPKQETPAVSKWDAPAGSHLSSVANDIPAAKVPDYLLRPDDKPQRDQFNKFLAGQRRQMFDTVARKTNSLMNMYTGIPDEDAKVDAYKRATDLTAMMNPADGEFSWGEENYGLVPWLSDAFSAIGQKMNEGQLEAAYGQMNRAQEWIDTSDVISEGFQKQQKFDDINSALKSIEAFYGGTPQWKDVDNYAILEKDMNEKINKLRTYYPDITVQNFPDYHKQLLQDRAELASDLLDSNSQYKKAERILTQAQAGYNLTGGKHLLRQIGIMFHDSPAVSSRWTGTTSDYFGDRVDESLDNLAGYQNASPEEKKQMIANFRKALYDVQRFDENQVKIQKQELEDWNKKHKISKEWHDRVRRAQQNYENPDGFWNKLAANWNTDNLLYNQVEQFGYSASSWDKQAAAMAINMTAMALSGGSSITANIAGGTLATTGAMIGVSSGADENNQEVTEGLKQRISNSLQNAGKDVIEDVMKEGKRLYPDASQDEILDKIAHLEFLPNNHKALKALQDARKGINATYEKDMAAVVSDEAFGAFVNGIGALPKGVGAGLSKKFADNAKYRFVRRKIGKAVNAAEEAVESSASVGLGLAGAPVIAAGKAAAKSKAGRWVAEQGTKIGEKIANSSVGKLVADGAAKTVEMGKIIPAKLLAKASPEARYMLEKKAKRALLGKEVLDPFGRVTRKGGMLSFAGKTVSKGISEAIEEGKQSVTGKEWVDNEDPEQVVGFFDLLLSDASKGLKLMPSAVGVPFGISLGMSNDPEIFSAMFGGFMGSNIHQASINTGSSILKAIGSGSYWGDQISIGDALAHNAVLDSHDALTRFTKGAELAKRLAGQDKRRIVNELHEYADFNRKRKEQGLSFVDPDLILQEEEYINKIANTARLQTTKDQAKAAGIKVGSDEYHKFVSASVMYNQLQSDAREKLVQTQSPIAQIIQKAVADMNSENALAFLEGEEAPATHPIVELFRRPKAEELKEDKDTANHARRAKNESKADYRKRVAEEKKNDQANEKALETSVANERESQATESDESIFARGLSALAELAGLTEYLNNIETLDKYKQLRDSHDVRWIKSRINKRIGELKAMINPSKLEEVMANPAAYFEDEETFDQLKDLFQTKMGAQLEYDAARMMSGLITGVIDPSLDARTKQLRIGWKLSKALDVIGKLQENVDKNYKLVDEVNKEFEARTMPKQTVQQNPDTPESRAVDEALAAAEEEMSAPQTKAPYVAPTADVRDRKKEYTAPTADIRDREKQYASPTSEVRPALPEPQPLDVVSVQELNDAIDTIKLALKEAGLEDSQASVPASDPRIILAGIKVMLYNLLKGDYSFDAGIIGTYQTFIDSGMSEASIWQLLPYFPSWYMAAAADPSMNEHYQEFDDIKMVKNTDIEAVIAAYVNANSSAEQQQNSLDAYKKELIKQNNLFGVFESFDEALLYQSSSNTLNKFAIIDPVTKLYEIYTCVHFGGGKIYHAINSDGIYVIKQGAVLTLQLIQSQYDEASRQPSPQDDAYKQLQKRIDEDNARVVAVTGHDYFIKDENGKVVMYPRVHTVLGDLYEESEEMIRTKQTAIEKIKTLIERGSYRFKNRPVVKFYGPTMGKTTAASTNKNLVDFDDIVRDKIKQLADSKGVSVRQLKTEGGKEYVDLLISEVKAWKNDNNNAGKTLVVSNAALAKTDLFDNVVQLPSKEEFVKRLVQRSQENRPKEELIREAEQYYEDLISKWYTNYEINDNFVSDIESEDLIEYIKDIDGYQLYLDYLNENPDAKEDVIEALGSLKAKKPAGPSVEVGNVADEIVRIFFDTDAQTITPLNYSTLTIKLQGKDFKISQLMENATFNELISSLTTLKETYDSLGYRISSKRHTWFAEFATASGVKRIAGETDLVAIDEQGKFHIIDTKTSKDTFAKEMRPAPSGLQEYSPFTDGHDLFDYQTNERRKARYSTKIQYSRQLTTYMLIMLKAMPNIVFAENPLEILPIKVKYNYSLVDVLFNGGLVIPPITKMFNGLYGQPNRIELDVQQDLINGLFATDDTTNQDVENLKQVIREYYRKVNQAMAEVAEKIEKTKQHPEVSRELSAILGLLNNLKDAIYRDSTILVNSNDRMTVESLMNNMDYQQKLESYLRMIETAMQKIPTVPQKTPTTDGFGWKEYNTADREQVNQSVAEDGSRLDDVTGNSDFDKEAVCEVISAPYTRKNGQIVVPIKITYKGKTYSRIEIQISDNSKGQAMVQLLMDAFAKKGPNDKIVLTGMKRTAGRVKTLPSFVNAIKSPLIAAKSLYDISTEYGKAMFGLAKRDKDSKIVRVLGQGNTPTGQNALYTFPAGRGTEGAVFAIIKPDYDSSTTLVTPLINVNFSDEDALTFAQLIQQRMLGDQHYRVELGDGTESEIPLTVEDLISMFLPIGQYDGKYNKASYVRFELNTVIFSTPAGERQFDPSTQASFNAMVDYIKSLRINVDQSIIDSRLGEATTNSHPFGRMANWFNRHPNVNSIRIGTSRFAFDRADFKNPNDPRDKKGLSGLGWMIKCGVFMSEYGGIHDPRFSFDNVELVKPKSQIVPQIPAAPLGTPPTTDNGEFNIEDVIVDEPGDYFYSKTQHGTAKNKVNKEKVVKRLQRIFGKDIAVEVVENIYDINGKLIPGVVGRLYSDVIKICERAAEGTEFHEAFHRVSLLLLPKSMQKILYRGIKNAMRKRLGKDAVENATDRQIEEFGANECERFFMGQTVNLTLRHPFEFILGHYQAYKNIGSLRMYMLYMAMNNGLFRNMKTRNTDIPAAYKFLVHGVGFNYIYDDRMYNTLIRSMLYYIMYIQKIRKDGKNINNLNLSKEIFDEKMSLTKIQRDKNGKVIYGKDGKPSTTSFETTLREMLKDSCRRDEGRLAAEEAIEKWDTVKMDMIEYIGSFGIDYRESIKNDDIVSTQDAAAIEEEKNALEGEVPNDIGNHTKEAYETSRTAKATTGIRFFTSMIKKYETDENGKQIEARNELGFYEFMDGKEVLVKMFSDLHDVKSPSQMVNRIQDLAKTDKTYAVIRDIVLPMYKHQYKADGTINANTEQFVTQLFNLMAAYHMEFKRINATKNRQDKLYTLKVESCGQEYESREYRKSWGMLLTYGGTSLFTRDENGKVALVEQKGQMNAFEKLGACFDKLSEIKQQFSQDNITKLLNGEEPTLKLDGRIINVTNEQDLFILKRKVCDILNYIGIEFSVAEFDYMLNHKYGNTSYFDQLNSFFNESGFADISNLWTGDFKVIVKDAKTGKWNWNVYGDNTLRSGSKVIDVENVYVNNSFCSELSKYKYMYNHETTDMQVLVSKGNTYYCISENNYISDVTDELSTGGPIVEMLSKYCYNYAESIGQTEDGSTNTSAIGSIILKMAKNLQPGEKLPIKVCTLVQFKTNEYGDEGSGYFDISEREDYTAKASILESGGIIFPTMSDKKTWVYIEGIQLPGIEYGQDKSNNFEEVVTSVDEDEVLEQMLEYISTEAFSIEQTIKQLDNDEISDDKKVVNYHKGKKTATVVDKKGVSHKIAQGTVFSSFVGMWDEDGKYISFNRVLDDEGNFIDPRQNLQKAKDLFFSKSHDEQKRVVARILDHQTEQELLHLEGLGLVKRNANNNLLFENVGLNNDAIKKIAKFIIKSNAKSSNREPNFVELAQATRLYVRDIVSKSIMSIQEIERVYSGNPAFYKFEFNNKGMLVDRSVDEFKRLGGLISTGMNNNTEIKGAPQDGMYVCAQVNNDEVSSTQIDKITEMMSICEWRQAARQCLLENLPQDVPTKLICDHVNSLSIEKLKEVVETYNPDVCQIVEKKIKKETSSYAKGIDVADGGAYISPQMTEWLLRMCGEYDARIQKAFEILKDPKADIYKQEEAYRLVTTKVIGAQKYTAFGMRLSEDGTTTYPYYNKMALFPVFKCIATGKFAKLYDQMEKQGVHMLMIDSAVKLGSQGSIDYSTDDSFKFNTYKQQFKYLRKQFNTNPHHKDEQSMGTQMVKVALSSLVSGNTYTKEDGTKITGRELLDQMMGQIRELSKLGKEKVDERFYTDGKIDQEKLGKFLREQLTSRDSDKSIIDAISVVKTTIADKVISSLKFPLSAISRINWLLSILVSFINDKVVDVNTQGNAFYQRSVWNMEGDASEFIDDENLPENLNGGKDLQMIIEDGPAKGAMDCILTMDYFADVLKKAGLLKASFDEQKKALMDAGIIGPNAKACFVGYRIPTQAQSSIHPLRCVDVLPVIQHNIILPKEFTKITGSDFDIDKIYIGSLNFNLKKSGDSWINDESEFTREQNLQNELIRNYISILRDDNGVHIAHRSIDNDTDLLKDVLADIEEGRESQSEVMPYDFYCLRTHTRSKNDFLTGKTGIGPFALNNNSLVLTMLYGVKFKENSLMDLLGHGSLANPTDDDGLSILSWISALINAHVDIAKDPYISRLNVNQMTYNLTNLLIRTGYGKNTFYFLTQPVMLKMAEKYRQAQGKFMQEEGKSSYQIMKEAKDAAALEFCGKDAIEQAKKLLYKEEKGKVTRSDRFVEICTAILENKDGRLRGYSKGKYDANKVSDKVFQALVYLVDKELERPAQQISNLVQYSKIDTKKQGKSVSEQLAYVKGIIDTFGDAELAHDILGYPMPKTHEDYENMYTGDFEFDSIQRMYWNSFIGQKTHDAIRTFLNIMDGQVFEATSGFRAVVNNIADMLGKKDATSIQKISDAVAAKIKADAINKYAEENGIDIPSLVTGTNTIYDRLNRFKCLIHTNPRYSYLLDGNGEIRNPLLKLLISDKSWIYNHSLHLDSAEDKFSNLKFIRLFDALDLSSSKTDYVIQAWDDLLNDASHPEVLKFARDLCVYAFVTSGDLGGRTKLFQYVPNSFRELSGYVDHIRQVLAELKDNDAPIHMMQAAFIDDVILNNADDFTFVPRVDISNKNWKEGDTKWTSVTYPNLISYLDKDGNKLQKQYAAKFPILVSVDPSTPIDAEDVKPFIKVKRSNDDGSQRSYTVLKLVGMCKSEKQGKVIPVYAKVNQRGYHIDGYDFYEYGSARVYDQEYYPSIDLVKQSLGVTRENIERFEATYGKQYTTIVDALNNSSPLGPEYDPYDRWIGAPKQAKTYAPAKENPAAPEYSSKNTSSVTKIISGGQTGVDTIGLEVGRELGIETGGTITPGFVREKGVDQYTRELLEQFGLQEISPEIQAGKTGREFYLPRTEQNVLNSDGTVYFATSDDSAGKIATERFANKHNKPFLLNPTARQLRKWLDENNIKTLNVAGNRGSKLTANNKVAQVIKMALTMNIQTQIPFEKSQDVRSEYGRLSGLKEDVYYTADEIHEAYKNMPEYEQYKELAEMVFATAKQFNIKFEAVNEPEDYRAGKNMKGDHVQYNIAKLKSSTLLHEAIHVCTSYWIEQYEDAPQNVKEALQELKVCYKIVKEEYAKSGLELPYGLTLFKEFVAELSNPNLVEIIKKVDADLEEQGRKQSIIDRIVSAIFTLFNINKQYDSIESTAKNALKQLITTVDKDLYGQHYEKYERLREESSDDQFVSFEEMSRRINNKYSYGKDLWSKTNFMKTVSEKMELIFGEGAFKISVDFDKMYVSFKLKQKNLKDNLMQRIQDLIKKYLGNPKDFNIEYKEDKNSVVVSSTERYSLDDNLINIEDLNGNKEGLTSYLYRLGEEMLRTKCTR